MSHPRGWAENPQKDMRSAVMPRDITLAPGCFCLLPVIEWKVMIETFLVNNISDMAESSGVRVIELSLFCSLDSQILL